MKKIFYLIVAIGVALSAFTACEKEVVDKSLANTNVGFAEYQYVDSILVNGVKTPRTIYKRINLNNAVFAKRSVKGLPDSLQTKFREFEVFLLSDSALYGVKVQPIRTSNIRISLIDSLKNETNPVLDMAKTHNMSTLSAFVPAITKVPVCTYLKGEMTRKADSTYTYTFSGDLTKKVTIYNLGEGIFQISANGVSAGKKYNVFYTGKILQVSDFIEP